VAADSVYGVGELEAALRRAGKGYVLGVNANHWFGSWNTEPLVAGDAKAIAEARPVAVPGLWTRGLLIRRSLADGELAYSTTWCPSATSIETLVRVEGTRWRVEESFETTKNELGLDHNESRSWHGWHRHVSLVMLAYAVMTPVRYQANAITPKKTSSRSRRSSSAGRFRKSDASF
jgi:SRSO17 transposase